MFIFPWSLVFEVFFMELFFYQGVARSFPVLYLCSEIKNVNTVRN